MVISRDACIANFHDSYDIVWKLISEAIFSPAIAQRMINFFSVRPALPPDIFPELTESERNVLKLMAQGTSNEAIAQQLGFSPKTVRNYVSNIFSKLQVADRAQAIVKAREAGLK